MRDCTFKYVPYWGFQFLGIPPKGELLTEALPEDYKPAFPISRDPPEGGTLYIGAFLPWLREFPISRDPPEGGTVKACQWSS